MEGLSCPATAQAVTLSGTTLGDAFPPATSGG